MDWDYILYLIEEIKERRSEGQTVEQIVADYGDEALTANKIERILAL